MIEVVMEAYTLLTGESFSTSELSHEEVEFLDDLKADVNKGAGFFDLLGKVKGPGAFPLHGGPITPYHASNALYLIAHDIADRAGIAQGLVLPPDRFKNVDVVASKGLYA
jgi:hypothetical protein